MGDGFQGGSVQKTDGVVLYIQEEPAEAAGRFMGAGPLLATKGSTGRRPQKTVEIADDLTNGDLGRFAGEAVASVLATEAFDPALLLHFAENVLKEFERYLIPISNFAGRHGYSGWGFQQGKQGQQGVIGLIGNLQERLCCRWRVSIRVAVRRSTGRGKVKYRDKQIPIY